MKLKSLDTANNYTDFSLPVLALDKETGKGKWVEGADVFVQLHNEFRQEFEEEKTAIKWDLETAINPYEEYFTIEEDKIEIKKSGFYEVNIQLFAKGKTDTNIAIEVSKNKELFGMRSVGTFDSDGDLSITLHRIIEIKIDPKQENNNTFQFSLRKALGQFIQLPYAASLVRIKRLK
jgi:hypothetical protein